MTGGDRAGILNAQVADPAWLDDAVRQVARVPAAVARLFPAVARHCGRGPLINPRPQQAGWTVADAARVLLLVALPLDGTALAEQVAMLYRHGDAAEKRAVLLALPSLDIGDGATGLLLDAIATNDPRLVAAAVGPYARHLGAHMWRQAVLKCVFMEIPLIVVADLDQRADTELGRMLAALADERRVAGRTTPADATALLALITAGEQARSRGHVRSQDQEKEAR